jgi:hypothetical protein
VDILKSYTDQAVVDTVRRALQHLNGLMDASDEAAGEAKNASLSIADAKSSGSEISSARPRRQSKDVSQSYSSESSSGKQGPAADRASFKTSSSSSSLLADISPPSHSTKRDQSSKQLHDDAVDSLSHKASALPPRSPRASAADSQPNERRGSGLSQSHSAFQLGDSTHKRLSALAAALDAGDAVGKLMAEMLVSKK